MAGSDGAHQMAQGDLAGALDLLDQAERLYDGNFSPNAVRSRRAEFECGWLKVARESQLDALVRHYC
ncbi:MAG: BTAD domain-containing putative transcriptional regulator [Anaerolineae bacterium]